MLLMALLASGPTADAETLLAPSGPNGVGRLIFHFQDGSRRELLSSQVSDKRDVGVWLWYPAIFSPGKQATPYIDEFP